MLAELETMSLASEPSIKTFGGGERRCWTCKKVKALTEFGKNARYPDKKHRTCRACVNEANRVQRGKKTVEERRERWRKQAAKFRAKYPERARALQRKALYGITQDQYDELVKRQNGLCAICSNPPGKRALHIDHCHDTGQIRGLLCSVCNISLGGFRDDTNLLMKAIEYLA